MKTFEIAVLPIPNVVFFPHTAIPIYVVESVYVRMVRDCIENDRPMAISMAEPVGTFEEQLRYTPRNICTMGRPIILEENDDGSLKILVKGVCRIGLDQIVQNLPYLIYRASHIPDQPMQNFDFENKLARLKEILNIWCLENIPDSIERESFYQNINTVHDVVDYLCMFLIQDREMRQLLLENLYLFERIQILNSLLQGDNPFFEDIQVANAIKSFEYIEKTAKVAH